MLGTRHDLEQRLLSRAEWLGLWADKNQSRAFAWQVRVTTKPGIPPTCENYSKFIICARRLSQNQSNWSKGTNFDNETGNVGICSAGYHVRTDHFYLLSYWWGMHKMSSRNCANFFICQRFSCMHNCERVQTLPRSDESGNLFFTLKLMV